MRPHIVRLWYGYEFEPEEGKHVRDSKPMVNLVKTIRLYQEAGTDVALNAMDDYFAYPAWMKTPGSQSKLPAENRREAMVRSYVDAVEYLRRELRLTNVKYLALFVEPGNDYRRPVPVEEYVRLHRLLDEQLKARGLRQEVVVLGSFDCAGPAHSLDPWCRKVLQGGLLPYIDVVTAHTYKHRNVRSLDPWVQCRLQAIAGANTMGAAKPFWITEFGYSNFLGNSTFENPEMDHYEYGLFAADFAIQALRDRVSATLIWCLAPVYYDAQVQQKASLWKHKADHWEPKPPFYSWSLLCRYTRPGSQVLTVRSDPPIADLRSVGLRSPTEEITLLVVNRCDRDVQIDVPVPGPQGRLWRQFLSSPGTVPTPDREMLKPVAQHRSILGHLLSLRVPKDSFLLLTNMAD